MPTELPVLTIANAAAWSSWLGRSAASSRGVWLTLAKKGTTAPTSLTYAQALDEALCHGWIDGQTRRRDEATYAQRFTPRAARSSWSQRNVAHIARLEAEGRMTDRGRAAVDAARADGRWDAAYAGSATISPPPEFLAALTAAPAAARDTWDVLTRQNRFSICHRLHGLKTQAGRERRIAAFVDMLSRGETPYPQKQRPPASRGASRSVGSETTKADKAETVSEVTTPAPRTVPIRRSARLRKTAGKTT